MVGAPQPRQADHLTPPKRHFFFFFKSLSSTSQKQPSLRERRARTDVGGLVGLGEGGCGGRGEANAAAREAEVWFRCPHLPPGFQDPPPAASSIHRAPCLPHTPLHPSVIPLSRVTPAQVWEPTPRPRHRRRASPACEWECDGMRRKSRAPLRLQARDRSTGGASPCRSFSLLHFRLTHFLPAPSPPS